MKDSLVKIDYFTIIGHLSTFSIIDRTERDRMSKEMGV